jgi:hypothetical protein
VKSFFIIAIATLQAKWPPGNKYSSGFWRGGQFIPVCGGPADRFRTADSTLQLNEDVQNFRRLADVPIFRQNVRDEKK